MSLGADRWEGQGLQIWLRPHLEELDPNAGEHELEQRGDNHNVPDGADGHEHALHDVLWGEAGGSGLALAEFPGVMALSEGAGAALHYEQGVVGIRLKGAKCAPSSQGDGAWGAHILLRDPWTKAPLTPHTLGQ